MPRPKRFGQRLDVELRLGRRDVPPRVVQPGAFPTNHDIRAIPGDIPRRLRVRGKRPHRPPQSHAPDKHEHGVHRGLILRELRRHDRLPLHETPRAVSRVGSLADGVEKCPVFLPCVDKRAKGGGRSLVPPLQARQSYELVRRGDVRGAFPPRFKRHFERSLDSRLVPGVSRLARDHRRVCELCPVAERPLQYRATPPIVHKLEPLPLAARVQRESAPLLQHRPGAHAEPPGGGLLSFTSFLGGVLCPPVPRG
mmetsp:Transcript_3756/g.17289  ORF Transcript_3756/g.17289 Transcript_3756/m.17289 type:complete len:253 (+) Transcript_3756:1439-2197(+)